jgi:hypothetical protein
MKMPSCSASFRGLKQDAPALVAKWSSEFSRLDAAESLSLETAFLNESGGVIFTNRNIVHSLDATVLFLLKGARLLTNF